MIGFGVHPENLSDHCLQRQFFERQQGKTETQIEFSHALMALLEKFKCCNSKGVSDEDVFLW